MGLHRILKNGIPYTACMDKKLSAMLRRKQTRKARNIPDTIRLAVYARDGYRCVSCGAKRNLTLDHARPTSAGGLGVEENLQTMCYACNQAKGSRYDGR